MLDLKDIRIHSLAGLVAVLEGYYFLVFVWASAIGGHVPIRMFVYDDIEFRELNAWGFIVLFLFGFLGSKFLPKKLVMIFFLICGFILVLLSVFLTISPSSGILAY